MKHWIKFDRVHESWYGVAMIAQLYVALPVTLVNGPVPMEKSPLLSPAALT